MATRLGGDVAERHDQDRRDYQERGQKKRDGEGQAHAVTLACGDHVTWPLIGTAQSNRIARRRLRYRRFEGRQGAVG